MTKEQEEMLLWSFKNRLFYLHEETDTFDICCNVDLCDNCEYNSHCHIQDNIDIVIVKEFVEKYPEYKIIL